MKRQFVKDLKPGTIVNDVFWCARRDLKDRRDGSQFLTFEIRDRTGSLPAIMWDKIEDGLNYIADGNFCHVQGRVGDYQGKLQITVNAVYPVEPVQVSRADFLPASRFNSAELMKELQEYISSIKNPYLRSLLESFFRDTDFAARFAQAPAAVRVHHAWLGGLLEHTVMMCRQANHLPEVYPEIDRDLLLTGCILHDIGKLQEYTISTAIEHTDEGKLLGHIVLGYQMVADHIRQIPDFPPELAKMVLHIILAHHGEQEYGAPKTPKFPEAFLVFALDYQDSRLAIFRSAMEKNRGLRWTEFNDYLETEVYLNDVQDNE
uniref:HD domain-containing protein n=1 Tax=candidate division WOR-3 bacterium TaxID=2052148 RepID=A0A7V3PTT6_UNCW3